MSRQEELETIIEYLRSCSSELFEAQLILAQVARERPVKSPLEPREGVPLELPREL